MQHLGAAGDGILVAGDWRLVTYEQKPRILTGAALPINEHQFTSDLSLLLSRPGLAQGVAVGISLPGLVCPSG